MKTNLNLLIFSLWKFEIVQDQAFNFLNPLIKEKQQPVETKSIVIFQKKIQQKSWDLQYFMSG